MTLTLPPDLLAAAQESVAAGDFPNVENLIETAVRRLLADRNPASIDPMSELGYSIESDGIYERIVLPDTPAE